MKVSLTEYAQIHGINEATVRTYVKRNQLTVIDRSGRYAYVDSDEQPRVHQSSLYGKQPRLSNILRCMRSRCYNPNNTHFDWYGGRGIKICDEWRHNFKNFVEWAMKNGYQDGLTIDRIDPDGDYCPDNCRWISRSENSKKVFYDHAEERKKAKADRVAYLDALREKMAL